MKAVQNSRFWLGLLFKEFADQVAFDWEADPEVEFKDGLGNPALPFADGLVAAANEHFFLSALEAGLAEVVSSLEALAGQIDGSRCTGRLTAGLQPQELLEVRDFLVESLLTSPVLLSEPVVEEPEMLEPPPSPGAQPVEATIVINCDAHPQRPC